MALMLLTLISALIMGYLVVWLASGGRSAELARRRAVLGATDEIVTETTVAEARETRETLEPSPDLPTPTFVPVESATVETPLPTVTDLPTEPSAVLPTDLPTDLPTLPPTRVPPTAAPAEPVIVNAPAVRLEDTAWQGGYRQGRGYGGRSATWVYGQSTSYTSMQTVVLLDTPPRGTAALTIEGMDSEDRVKTPIRITVNGSQIFSGPNPLPNDDLPLATGTWAAHTFSFDAALLQPGRNVIRITNLAPGSFGLPPFFMLDYAVLSLPSAARQPPPATAAAPPAPPTSTAEPPTDTALPTDTPPPPPTEPPTEPPVEQPTEPAAPTGTPESNG